MTKNILIELGATAPRNATADENGEIPLTALLEQVLGRMMEQGLVLDAVIARNETQRAEMWKRHEASAELAERITETIEGVVQGLGGSFSAEHGVGLSKKPSMARRKDKVALGAMRQIKMALDPLGIMNPGKLLP